LPQASSYKRVLVNSLSKRSLYGILDLGYVAAGDALRVARAMVAGGVDILQLRAKHTPASDLHPLACELQLLVSDAGVPLIINDHPELARDTGAAGVHVGQDDLSVDEARRIVGRSCIVGKSTHSLEQAQNAAAEGADYIGFGPLFATPTKPDYVPIGLADIAAVHQLVSGPIFCIGGIKLHNLPQVLAAGAERVVIVSELLQAPDVAQYARAVKALLNQKSEIKK
jgi:thiamine-phosphate pyrophosphorylase